MRILLSSLICIFLNFITLKSLYLCPSGEISYQDYNRLSAELSQHSSQNLDIFYHIINLSPKYTLYRYQVSTDTSSPDMKIVANVISIEANNTWSIETMSKQGNCVGIRHQNYLSAYQTSNSSFKLIRKFLLQQQSANYDFFINDDCTILQIKVTQKGNITHFVQIASQNITKEFPPETIFDKNLKYGIDAQRNLYFLQNGQYNKKLVDGQVIMQNLVGIFDNEKFNAVTIISNNAQTNDYSVFILDRTNDSNFFHREIKGQNLIEQISIQIQTAGDYIIVRDTKELKLMLNLEIFINRLKFVELKPQQNDFKSLFSISSHISCQNNMIFVYQNQKMNYFQVYDSFFYLLRQLNTDIQTNLQEHLAKNSSKEPIMFSFTLNPSSVEACEIQSVDTINQNYSGTVVEQAGKVFKCDSSCNLCQDGGKCKICALGFVLYNYECVSCRGCRLCNPSFPELCYSCFQPQVINTTSNKCQVPKCSLNCIGCKVQGQCQKCISGYSLFQNKCLQCKVSGCLTCMSSLQICDKDGCKSGYTSYIDPNTNKSYCAQCAAGCLICDSTNILSCNSCNIGFYKSSQANIQQCKPCFNGCINCKDELTCIQCSVGFILNLNKTQCQVECNQSCLTCNSQNKSQCVNCFKGNFLNLSTGKCDINHTCSTDKTCVACPLNYVISGGQCLKCTYNEINCLACSSKALDKCSKCVQSYYLQKDYTCKICKKGCSQCLNQDSCTTCVTGSYLVSFANSVTGICVLCYSKCKSCEKDANRCNSCHQNYNLVGTKCVSYNNIAAVLTIAIDIKAFIQILVGQNGKSLAAFILQMANFYRLAGSPMLTQNQFAILNLTKGSSIVEFTISTQEQENSRLVAAGLRNRFNILPNINGYTVLTSGVTENVYKTAEKDFNDPGRFPNNPPFMPPDSPEQSSPNIVLIVVAIVVPMVILIAIAIGVIVYRRRREIVKEQPNDIDLEFKTDSKQTEKKTGSSQGEQAKPETEKELVSDIYGKM